MQQEPRRYSRSWYQLHISEIDPAVLQRIIAWMGKPDANGPLAADSSGFGMTKYEDWENAKYGEISVKQFKKLHVIVSLHGKICAATVTPGLACDSPQLRQMVEFLPHGDGNDVMADAIYWGSTELQCNSRLWKKTNNCAKIQLYNKGVQRKGTNVTVLREAPWNILQQIIA